MTRRRLPRKPHGCAMQLGGTALAGGANTAAPSTRIVTSCATKIFMGTARVRDAVDRRAEGGHTGCQSGHLVRGQDARMATGPHQGVVAEPGQRRVTVGHTEVGPWVRVSVGGRGDVRDRQGGKGYCRDNHK